MAQFDVYRNTLPATQDTVPYLLDVQSDLLEPLATRVVVPLFLASAFGKPMSRLNPAFTIEGHDVILSVAELAGVSVSALGPAVANFGGERQAITAAIDMLFTGI